jgi:hypothetical protein
LFICFYEIIIGCSEYCKIFVLFLISSVHISNIHLVVVGRTKFNLGFPVSVPSEHGLIYFPTSLSGKISQRCIYIWEKTTVTQRYGESVSGISVDVTFDLSTSDLNDWIMQQKVLEGTCDAQ